jgi:Zn-dependent protease/CBS domain-containing protein
VTNGVRAIEERPKRRLERTLALGRIAGVRVELEWSLVVVAVLLTWMLATSALPALVEGEGLLLRWAVGAVTAAAFIACVLAHELAHVVMARHHGVRASGIRLWLLGGVSSLEGEAPTARADFQIAIVGPATSAFLACVFLAGALVLDAVAPGHIVTAALLWLAGVNSVVAVFNMLPGAPLDGGRVLRALLWKLQGNRALAAVRAARAGRALGWLLVAAGLAEVLVFDSVGGVWVMLIGWFVVNAAEAEEVQTVVVHELAGVRVRDVMSASPVCAPRATSVEDLLHDYVLRHHCSSFPLLDDAGAVHSLVTLSDLRRVPSKRRAEVRADAIACPVALVTRATPDEPLVAVVRRSKGTAGGRVLVFDGEQDGAQLVGIVSPSDVARVLRQREATLIRGTRAA